MGQAEDAIRKLLSENGKLLEVTCEDNPKRIRMFFENAEVLGDCSEGYFMQFGYSGTGPRCFWQFLDQAGFDISYDQVTELKAPVTLRPRS